MKVLVIALLMSVGLAAQQPPQATVGGNQRFGWSQDAPTSGDANSYSYKYYLDGSTTGAQLSSVTCTGTVSPFFCSAPIPAFTPGNHTITLTAGNIAGESPKSDPFAFNIVVTPAVPTGIRIVTGTTPTN